MDNILLLDTSIASLNKGDDIIMECVRKELNYILNDNFELNLPTHVSAFHWYQILRGLSRVKVYEKCKLKFVGGTNLLVKNMFTYYPQWNVNLFNYQAIKGCVLVGVGVGPGSKTNRYTTLLYQRILNSNYTHSVRDQRSLDYLNSLGLRAINTGCVTMWMLTPEFCNTIPTKKSDRVVFTLTANISKDPIDQKIIDILNRNYNEVYFWVQGDKDFQYFQQFNDINNIHIISPNKEEYHNLLLQDNLDYVGTRLHAGIYAMRHTKRAIILAIDERAREINKCNNINCIEKSDIHQLEQYICSDFKTDIRMPFDEILRWKKQFQ